MWASQDKTGLTKSAVSLDLLSHEIVYSFQADGHLTAETGGYSVGTEDLCPIWRGRRYPAPSYDCHTGMPDRRIFQDIPGIPIFPPFLKKLGIYFQFLKKT